jgi:hypothetical protein
MRLAHYLLLLFVALAGCRIVSTKQVILPGKGHATRVECNYEFANCTRYAEDTCHGRYERVSDGDMTRVSNRTVRRGGPPGSTATVVHGGYRGVLYFRCP